MSGQDNPTFKNERPLKIVHGSAADSVIVVPESLGSESPRSIRSYHKGSSGTLTGGGVKKIYNPNTVHITHGPDMTGVTVSRRKTVDMKQYKSKLDQRLGFVIVICLITIATILCIFGLIHESVHPELTTYVNRTHQIAREIKVVMDEDYGKLDNKTAEVVNGKNWMDVDELAHDAYMLSQTHSTIWWLFIGNLLVLLFVTPCVIAVHCAWVQGNGFKIVYRAILVLCLIWFFAQFFYLLHPLLFGAGRFPGMVDRLFITGYPRDEYQLNELKNTYSCEWVGNPVLLKFDLERECLPRIKNSLFPVYTVLFLIVIDLFPFIFAVFTYAWSACIKDHKHVTVVRMHTNDIRQRINIPRRQNGYIPPDPKLVHVHSDDKHGRFI